MIATAKAKLAKRWFSLMDRTVDDEVAEKKLHLLMARHTKHPRKPTTLLQLLKALEFFDFTEADCTNPKAVQFAIFYRDAVCSTDPSKELFNESKSAELAIKDLTVIYPHRSDEFAIEVAELIMATAPRKESGKDWIVMHDADLAPLASTPAEWRTYSKELAPDEGYSCEDLQTYLTNRRDVLNYFLKQPRVYLNDALHNRYDVNARRNLTHEVESITRKLRSQ